MSTQSDIHRRRQQWAAQRRKPSRPVNPAIKLSPRWNDNPVKLKKLIEELRPDLNHRVTPEDVDQITEDRPGIWPIVLGLIGVMLASWGVVWLIVWGIVK